MWFFFLRCVSHSIQGCNEMNAANIENWSQSTMANAYAPSINKVNSQFFFLQPLPLLTLTNSILYHYPTPYPHYSFHLLLFLFYNFPSFLTSSPPHPFSIFIIHSTIKFNLYRSQLFSGVIGPQWIGFIVFRYLNQSNIFGLG